MANANLQNKLVVTDLDFDTIKFNLKNFMRSQELFSDYDFEGSALSNLIDLLAYNTHYMGFYANMIANEAFLDTASIRDSVVSHAKMLGYTPHSTTSAIGKINLSFTDSTASTSLTLPRFTQFASSALNGVNYIFVNLEEKTIEKDPVTNEFKFINVSIVEGIPVNYTFTYNMLANPQAEFEIPDSDVDTSTIEVIVQNSSVDLTQETYKLGTTPTSIDENSRVYFLDEIKNQQYKIYFGNGIIGNKLSDGNIVIISYLISKGTAANKATNFTLLDSLSTNGIGTVLTNPTVTVVQAAAGGTQAESIESVKFAAPKSYISNNRAVTKNDYIALIKKNYPSLEAVNVWGGEENNPPAYGKVFISAKPALGYDITLTEKQYIIDTVINPMSILTVTPEFVNPDYVYLRLDARVTYDPTATTKTPGEIETTAKQAIYNFGYKNLNNFNSYFRLSRMLREIDNSDPAILSTEVDVLLEKRLSPVLGSVRNYTIDFHTELKRSTGRTRIKTETGFTSFDDLYNIRTFYFEEVPSGFTGITGATIRYGGANLDQVPTLKVFGDGVGAQLTAIVTNGKITSVEVVSKGSEYSTAYIKAYDMDGVEISGISIAPILDSSVGELRTYYFDDNQLKQIYPSYSVGTIDYTNGILKLKNFQPLNVDNDLKILKFLAVPQNSLFVSEQNSILTLDIEDVAATRVSPIQVK